ncbi:serine/threonine protein kinase [Nostoc sp. MBR 210]|uniref:Protein kinase n=1 Tax=Nostoc spongiaeforme FACHB-130 TaxID=1357510 RepID=A0ABR8FY99_9NOSO|nr:protein kinase [Nostoc spongiaeforme]MBD2596132.1 protein kinase [Nostoc spongiaeforme FACHB-130]OCR00029.1 serine/threonine protein kinase [Nostoc sp. MBR 210]
MITEQILGDRYEIQQQLGKKAGRRTFVARDLTTQELVIIKLLSFNSDFEWDDLKLFEREAETLKSLSHPAIPRYIDYFEVNSPTIKGFALVQTYIPSQTLEQCLQSGRSFTEVEVKQIATAILEILIYLHCLNPPVIHRDLKPSNILLGDRSGNSVGQVYLVDFGSVQTVLATEGGTRTVVGTYGYMPPEQFGGRTVPASDLYSLGATLIYLVTGTHPADLPQKDLQIQFDGAVHLSSGLTRWLKWMTEPSLDRRLSSANAALAALEHPQLLQKLQPAGINLSDWIRGHWYWDGNHWVSNNLTIDVSKPVGSKIQLTKNEDCLEIRIPPSGFKASMLFTGTFAIAWNSFILFWTINVLAIPFPANIPFALFSLPFWVAGFFMISNLMFGLSGSIRLYVDSQQITYNRNLWGWAFHKPQLSLRQNISKLVYIPQHLSKYKDDNGYRITVPAQLDIWVGTQRYSLGGHTGIVLSAAEIEWLAYELSDWLKIPLSQD